MMNLAIDRSTQQGDLADQIDAFAGSAKDLSDVVIDQLGLADFARIGCRAWYLFDAETLEEARKFLASLEFVKVSPAIADAFSGEIESTSLAITLVGKDRKFRIGMDATERAVEVDLGEAVVNVPIHLMVSGQRLEALKARGKSEKRRRTHPPFAAVIDVDAYRENPSSIKPEDFIKSSL
jgi:hypothetical protein